MATPIIDTEGRLTMLVSDPVEGVNITVDGDILVLAAPASLTVDLISQRIFPQVTLGGGGYLLDSYLTDAVGFWSRRKVTSDTVYSGAIERIRVDTTGQPEYDINAASDGLFVDTAQELTYAGSNSAYIAKRYNQVGSGSYDMVQATVGNQWRVVNHGINDTIGGYPVMDKGIVGAYNRTPGILPAMTKATTFAVIAQYSLPSQLIWSTNSLQSFCFLETNDILHRIATSTGLGPHGQSTGVLFLVTSVIESGACDLRVNGSSVSTTDIGAFPNPSSFDEGYSIAGNCNKTIAETLLFKNNLGADIPTIEADIMAKWGIA